MNGPKLSYQELAAKVKKLEAESSRLKQAEIALQESQTRYRAMVEAFDGLIYVCSQDYRVEFMNARFIARTGYNPIGERCYKALHNRDSICPWCVNDRVFKGETVRWEMQSPKDHHWYYVVNTPIYHADGSISKQAMILDITDRKRKEKLLAGERQILEMVATGRPLQETLDALARLVEQLLVGIYCSVLVLDAEGQRLHHCSAPSLPNEYVQAIDGLSIGPAAGSCGTAAYRRETVIVEDTTVDPLWSRYRDLALRFGLRSCWSVPIFGSSGQVLGTFALYDGKTHRPSEEELQLIETAADLAGIAIEARASEEALRESEEKYRTLFEKSRDAICVTTKEGRFIDVNQATLELFGYTREEMIEGLNAAQLYVHPGYREQFKQQIESEGSIRDFEVKFLTKDGTEIDCLITSTVLRSKDGSLLGYQNIIRDITKQKQGEWALRKSVARYRAIVEDQTDLICRSLPDGRLTFVNEAYCRYFYKTREELIGTKFMPTIHPEDRDRVKVHLASLHPQNQAATIEHRVITPDGEIRWQQWTNRMILDDQGQPLEFQSVGRDITEQKLMEEALRKSAEKTKHFAYSVSHDLKSPAIGIHGLAKRLYQHYADLLDEQGKNYCAQIITASEQIATLVEKINVFISTKEVPLNIEKVKLTEILQIIRDEFSTQLNIRQINWVQPPKLPEIMVDRLSLIRALRNLVDNALKYGGDELSEIRIGHQERGQFHIISVKDDGIGLNLEDQEKIFGVFQRRITSKGIEGTGLGLAIVKEVVEQHGGRVWMDSAPQKGTTFYLALAKSPDSI
ncbi:MAG: PAS domain S-box protein [Deltaproteobacteria bacterium]|nr:PAS domain S-box protein [Deltaproteobacteria bacterium]